MEEKDPETWFFGLNGSFGFPWIGSWFAFFFLTVGGCKWTLPYHFVEI